MPDLPSQPPPPPDVPANHPQYGYPHHAPALIPLEPLEHSLPSTNPARTKPGVLTLAGVRSIAVACLGIVGGLLTLGAALYFSESARAASAAATATARQSAPSSLQPPAIVVGPAPTAADGLDEPQGREAI